LTATRAVDSIAVCSEPIGVAVSPDGGAVWVACSQDDVVARIDAAALAVTDRVPAGHEPWALAWSPAGYRAADITALPEAALLTPPSSLRALSAGYRAVLHPSARGVRKETLP